MNLSVNPPLRLLVMFEEQFPGQTPDWIVQAPGREMWVVAVSLPGDKYSINAADLDSQVTFNWRGAKQRRTLLNRPLPKWARYPAGVVYTLNQMDIATPGIEAIVAGEEPSGPRYDYALAMAFAALWYEIGGHDYDTDTLIEVVDRVHRDYLESS